MFPPFPDTRPPVALRLPAILVLEVDQIWMLPPLPTLVADTSTKALVATLTWVALIKEFTGF